jgi:hypothetical protein
MISKEVLKQFAAAVAKNKQASKSKERAESAPLYKKKLAIL